MFGMRTHAANEYDDMKHFLPG